MKDRFKGKARLEGCGGDFKGVRLFDGVSDDVQAALAYKAVTEYIEGGAPLALFEDDDEGDD